MLQRGLSLLLLPIVTRVLGVSDYGLVSTATALAALLAIVFGLGTNFAIVRAYYDDPPDAPVARWSALLYAQIVIAGGMGALAFVTGPLWSHVFKDIPWGPALQLAVLYAFLTAVGTTLQGVLIAARKPLMFGTTAILQAAAGGGLGIVLAAEHGAAGYLGGLCIGSVAVTVVALAVLYRPPLIRRDVIVGGLALGFPFMFHSLSQWGLIVSDRLIVAFYLGLDDVGRYNVAYVLASVMTLLLSSVQSAWAPHFIGQLGEDARRRMPPLLVLPVTAVVIAATILLVLTAPVLLEILTPDGYGGTELIIALVASATVAQAPYFVSVVVLMERRNTKMIAFASLVGALVNLALNLTLIPVFGLEAAAASTAVAYLLHAVLIIRWVERTLGTSMHLLALGLAWVAALAVLVAASQLPDSELGMALRVMVAIPVCAGAFLAIRWLRRNFRAGQCEAAF